MVIGGRVDSSNVATAVSEVDAVIIGSALKRPAGIRGPVVYEAARQIVEAAGSAMTGPAVQKENGLGI
jgi:predicted TIM-barrel enzyme